MTGIGLVTVRPDALPMRCQFILDASAAAVIGWPAAVTVDVSDNLAQISAASEAAPNARPTWRHNSGGLACCVRVGPECALSRIHHGKHVAEAVDGGLVSDLTKRAPKAVRHG